MMHVVEAGFENSRWEKERKILFQEDFGHVLGNASRFSSTHAKFIIDSLEKEMNLGDLQIHVKII